MSSGEQAGSWGTFERHQRKDRRGVANYVWLLVGLSALVCVGLLWAGRNVTASPTSELVEHNTLNAVSAHQEQLSESECCAKNFDPEKIYDDPKDIDQMHPNRIDFYGPMFHNFPQGTDTVMEKVSSLKHKLVSLLKRQKAFEAQLQKPVQTTIQVLPGEPGRLGPRGRRGNVGPQGYPGNTGPMGRPGYMGRPGLPGDEGDAGPRGPPGLTGDQGPQGVQGDRGPPGPRGPQGPAGPAGKKGPTGYPGENGPKGMDGQQGNKGPMGLAPRGPPGPAGPEGPKGPQGGKGGKGLRGPPGPPGQSGLQGDPGVKGVDGKPGKDAKRLPKSVCGVQDKVGRSVCCGESPISWQNYGPNAFIDVDARKCKFTDNDVLYFSDVYGSGGQWEEIGISSIYSTSKTGFRIYVHAKHRWRSSVPAWWANALRHRVQWCGVGMSEGPKVNAMCCGVQPSRKIYNWGAAAYTDVDIKACNVAGSPVVITAMAATSASARNYDTIGVSANYYSIGPRAHWFRQWFGGHSSIYWVARRGRALSEGWNPNWCVFGNTFPSGDMQVATDKRFDKDDYPCKGVRVLDDTKVVTDGAKPCCGVTDHNWKQVGGGLLEKRVTTSQCKFKGTPVFLTSVRGNSNHWMTTGTNAYSDYSADGFTMRLMWKHYTIPASMAARHDWRIQWCGIGEME